VVKLRQSVANSEIPKYVPVHHLDAARIVPTEPKLCISGWIVIGYDKAQYVFDNVSYWPYLRRHARPVIDQDTSGSSISVHGQREFASDGAIGAKAQVNLDTLMGDDGDGIP
jgi:hypothetical protein